MQMILLSWLHVHLLLDVCWIFAVTMLMTMVCCSMLAKLKLICFRSCKYCRFLPLITFNNTVLPYKNEVMHLGHVLSFDLNDGPDKTRALKDLNRKALCTFYFADCFVKCFLIKLHCLALYGCCLWHLGSQSLHLLQTALNKLMRKVWHLPSRSMFLLFTVLLKLPAYFALFMVDLLNFATLV